MAKISEAARLRAIEYQKQNDALRGIPQAENAGIPEAIGQQPAPQSGEPQLSTTGSSGLDFLKDVGGVAYDAAADFQHPIVGTGVALDAFQKGVIGGVGGMIEKGTTSAVVADFKRNYIDGDSPFKNLTYNIYKDMMNKVNAQKVKTPQGGTTLSYGQETTPTATNPGNVSASENQRAIEDSFVNMQMKNRASAGDDTYSHGKDGKNYSMVGGALLDMSDYISKQIDAPEQGYELFRGFGNMASFAVGGMAKAGLSKLGMKTASKYAANMGTGIMIAAETDGYLDGVIKERGVAALGDPIVMSTALGVGVANAIIEKKFGFDPTNLAAKAAMKASIKEGAMDILEKGITRETLGTVGKTASRIVGEAAGTAVSEGTQEVLQSLVGDVTKYGITSLYGKGVVDNPLSETDTRKLIHGYATDFAIGGMIGGLMNGFQNAVDGKEDRNAAYDYIRNGNSSFNPESAGGYVADKFRDFKDFFHNEDAGNSPADIRRRADKVKAAMANKVQGDWEIIQNNAGITDEQRIQQLDEAKQKYEQGAAAIDNLANLAINIPSRVGEDASFQAYQILEKKKALKELIKADTQLTGDEDIDNAALALNDSDIKAREELMGIYDKQLKEIGKDGATTIDKKEQALLRQVGLSEYAEPLLDKKDSKAEGIVNEGLLLNDETSFVAPNGKTFAKDNGQWVGLEKISEADSIDNVDPITGVKTKEAIPAKYRVDTKLDTTDKQDNIQAAYEASGSAKRVQNDAAAEADRINKEELKKEQDAKIELDKQIKDTNDELARIKKENNDAQNAELKELRIESARLTNEAKRAGIKAKEKASLEKEAKAKNDEAAAIESAEYKKDEREIKYEKLLQDLYNAQDLAVKKIDEVQSRINVNEEKLETQKARTEQVRNGKSKSGNADKSTFSEALADREFKKFFDTLEPHIMYGLQVQDVPWETVSDISLDENDESGDRASVKIPGFGWANIPFELVGGDKVFKYFIAKGIDEYSEKDLLHFPHKGEIFAVTPEGEVSINRRNPGVRIRVANSSLTPDGKQTDKKSPDLTKREGILKGIKKAFESGSSGSDAVKEAVTLIYENYKNGLVALNIGDVAHIANKIAEQGEVWSGELDARFIELFNLGMDLGSSKKEAAFAKLAKEMGMNVGKMVSDIALSTVIDKAQAVRDIVINQAFKDGLLTDVKIRELKNRQLNEKPTIVDRKDRGAEYTGGENSEGADQEVQSGQPDATETQANGEGAAVAEKPSTETAKSTESGGRNAGTGKTGTTKGAKTTKDNDVEGKSDKTLFDGEPISVRHAIMKRLAYGNIGIIRKGVQDLFKTQNGKDFSSDTTRMGFLWQEGKQLFDTIDALADAIFEADESDGFAFGSIDDYRAEIDDVLKSWNIKDYRKQIADEIRAASIMPDWMVDQAEYEYEQEKRDEESLSNSPYSGISYGDTQAPFSIDDYLKQIGDIINEGDQGIAFSPEKEADRIYRLTLAVKDLALALIKEGIATINNVIKEVSKRVKVDKSILDAAQEQLDVQFSATTLLAPNGKKSNLTPEQHRQVRTKEFKDWFGDWENDPENSSKVVDENGEPLVVYHSTNEEFSIFDKKKIGKNYTLRHGNGFYFSSGMLGNSQWGNKTESYFLNIKNIAKSTLSLKEEAKNSGFLDDYDNSVDIVSYAKTINIDGFYAGDNFSKEYVAFDPNQIKSATDNNGEFSLDNNDIRFQKTAPAQADSIEQVKKLAAKMSGKFKGSKIKFFTDKDRNIDGIQLKIGEKVWGIKASDGTIYLNLDGISFEAAIHEFSHLWEAVYPSKFLEGVSILKGTKEGEDLFEELRNNKSYEKLTDNQIWREALNTAIGRKGQDLFKGTKLMRFKEYLKSFFRGVGEKFGFTVTPDMKLKDFLNLAVGEITNSGGNYKDNGVENSQKKSLTLQQKIDEVKNGKGISRLSREEEAGRARSGPINAIATIITEAVHRTIKSERGVSNPNAYSKTSIEEELLLEDYAKENGLMLDLPKGEILKSGNESDVYDSGADVTKVTNLNNNNTWLEFMDGIAIHNMEFPETAYEILGFTRNEAGEFSAVMKQQKIEGRNASDQEIKDNLESQGYTMIGELGDATFQRDGIILEDVKPDNVLVDKDGNFFYIDTNMYANTTQKGGDRTLGTPYIDNVQFNAAMAFGDGRFESGIEVDLGLDPSKNLVEQLVQTDWSDMLEKDNFDQLFDNFVAPIHEDISGKGNPVWQEILGNEDLRELVRAEIIDESSEKEIVDKVSKIGTKDDAEVGKKIKEVAKQLRDNEFFKSEIPNMSPHVYYDEIENKFYKIDAKKEAALVKKSGVFVGAIARLMGSSKQLDTILLGLQEPGGFLSKIRVMMQGEALDRKDKVKDRLKKKLMALIDKFPELTNQTTERPITFDGVTINLSEAFSLFLQDERVLRETGSRFIGGLKTFQDVKGDTHPLNDYQVFYDALDAGMKKYGNNTLAAAKADFESFFNDSVVKENMRPAMLVTQGITDFKLGVPIIEAADDRPFLMASFSPGPPKAASGKVEGKVLHSLPLNEVMANHMSQVENFIEAAEYTHHVEQWNKKYGKSAYEFKPNPNAGMAQKLKDAVSSKLLKNAFPESLDSRIKNVGGTGKLKTLKFLQFLSNSMSRSQFALNLSSGAIQSLGIVSLAVSPMRRGYGKAIVQFFKKSATSIGPVFEALTNIANNKKYERMTRHDVEDYLNASWLPFKKLGWADTVAEMKQHSPYLYGRLNNSFFEINEILRDSSEIRGNYKNKQAEALNRLGRNLSINQTVGDIGVIIAEWQMSKKEYMNNPITVPYNGSKIVLKGFEAVAFAAKANVQATQVVHDMSQMTNLKMAAQRGDQVAQLISAMFPFITENLKRMNMAAFYAMQKEAPAGFTNAQWQMKRKLAFPTAMAAMTIGYKLLSGLWSSLRFDCGTEKMDEVFDRVLSVPKTGIQTTDLLTNMVGAPPILGQLSYQMKGLDTKTVKKYGDDYEWGEFGKSFHPTDVVADLVTIGYAKKIEKELMDDTRDGSLDVEEYGMWAVEAASALAGIPKTLLAIADCFRR